MSENEERGGESTALSPGGAGKLILVVDDDFDIRDTLSQVLADEGYRVVCAGNGLEALDLLRAAGGERPALILLDLMMPVMSGWQLRLEQRKDPELAAIPVVVISAASNTHERAVSIDAAAYLTKPIALDRLLETIARFAR
ncbi:MAG: response regulator [Myxococcota bacterium]